MKLSERGNFRRFSSPTILRGDTPFMGATVQQWDDVFTGSMSKTLIEVKRRVMSGPRRDVSQAITSDLASFAGRRLAGHK